MTWHSMETKNTINGSREFDIFNWDGDLIATVYTDAGEVDCEAIKANARLIANAKNMYHQLRDVESVIRHTLPLIPETVNTYDLQVQADLINEILTSIDGKEA